MLPLINEQHKSLVVPANPADAERRAYEAMGYRFVGTHKHSAIKICEWCRRSLGEKGHCYKQKFYDIDSHECVQMSPTIFVCTENCLFCWRAMRYHTPDGTEQWDTPVDIVDGCLEAQHQIVQGFGGNPATDPIKLYEAERPRHVAISLSGEPTLYPMIGELISEFHSRGMTTFLVSNGTLPERLQSLLQNNQQPTQMYLTVGAPNKATFQTTVKPMFADAWDRLQRSLSFLQQFNRSVIRLTLAKGLNMIDPEGYAQIADRAAPRFLEIKGYVAVGGARTRIPYDAMPRHEEVVAFAEAVERASSYHIVDQKEDSRVVLLMR